MNVLFLRWTVPLRHLFMPSVHIIYIVWMWGMHLHFWVSFHKNVMLTLTSHRSPLLFERSPLQRHDPPPTHWSPKGTCLGLYLDCQPHSLHTYCANQHEPLHTHSVITVKSGCVEKVGCSQVVARSSSSWLNVHVDLLYSNYSENNWSQNDQRVLGAGWFLAKQPVWRVFRAFCIF